MNKMLERTNERRRRVLAALQGNRLTKAQLCERFAVSRDVMTDMLDVLIRDGLVQRFGNSGRWVAYEASRREGVCPPNT